LAWKDGLTLGVGTGSGQVLLYDIRSARPLLVKDHHYGLPITDVAFHNASSGSVDSADSSTVFSMDSKVVKIWGESTGSPITSVEGDASLNNLALIPHSGLFFIANEDRKILTYYIPVSIKGRPSTI
jgi:ribosome biogenesis protein ENP2